ncbi:MAG TPA: MFS transporter [Vicinamibacterales bacterium]|jgi:ACS family hexuronate transporter-like MFS transporter
MANPTISARPQQSAQAAAAAGRRTGYYRWIICGLLFFAATINYIDRQVIGILKPTLQKEFGWSEIDYADIVFAFQLAYAIAFLFAGKLIDWVGTKKGFIIAIVIWSVAAMAHAEVELFGPMAATILAAVGLTYSATVAGFIVARLALGFGEAGNFPAAIKVTAEWFPKRERALATGLFNSGTNIGALVTPLVVPVITLSWGWYWAFIITGALGFLWLLLWIPLYGSPDTHPRVSASELALIRSDPPDPPIHIPWTQLLKYRQTWAFALGKFMTDPVWWLYLFWIPDFLNRNYGIDLRTVGPPLVAIYLIADVGSIGGGWLSSFLLKRGWTPNAGRKVAMLAMATSVIPIMFASNASSVWVAVTLVGIAAAAHQGWSANLFTLTSDMFPRQAVGSVVGLGGFAGAVGGMLIAKITGYILEASGSYVPIFFMAAFAYLTALLVIHLLVPRLEPVKM